MILYFHPVFNLPFVSKTQEKVVLHQPLQHFVMHSVFEPFQLTKTLMRMVNGFLSSRDRSHISVLSMLDLSATLSFSGFMRTSASPTQSLAGSTSICLHPVCAQGCAPKPAAVLYEVSRGSVLEPLLFSAQDHPHICR